MTNLKDQELSERVEARTNRILIGSGTMFLVWQLAYFVIFSRPAGPMRNVDLVASIGFIAWSAALLMLLATSGGAFRSEAVRRILQDERARANRAAAYQNAFWTVMIVSLGGYIAAYFSPLSPMTLAHVTLSAGVLVAVATVATLNRQ